MKTMKKLSESKFLLEGIIWGTNYSKAINYRSPETGFLQHSIVVDGLYYYPIGTDGKKIETLELENNID